MYPLSTQACRNRKKHFRATEAFGANSEDVTTNVMLKLPRKCRGLESGLPCPTAKEWRCACHNTIVRIIGLYNQCNGTNCHQSSESIYNNEHTLITKPEVRQTILSWLSREILAQGIPLRSLLPRRIRARWSACRVTPTPTEAQDTKLSKQAMSIRPRRLQWLSPGGPAHSPAGRRWVAISENKRAQESRRGVSNNFHEGKWMMLWQSPNRLTYELCPSSNQVYCEDGNTSRGDLLD